MFWDYVYVLAVCGGAIVIGTLLGNGAVYLFNRVPGQWLVDYGEEPDEELLRPTKQRIRSTPWKYVFSGFFIGIGIYLGVGDPSYAFAVMIALWFLVEMSIADIKYMIVPDQFVLFLAACGAAFVPHHAGGYLSGLWGGLLGLGILAVMALVSRLVYKKPAIGGGDVKLFGALGLVTGLDGIIFVFLVSTFLSAGHFIWLMTAKKAKLSDERPMVPYFAAAAAIYLVFFRGLQFIDLLIQI